jgi:hypothetical protein
MIQRSQTNEINQINEINETNQSNQTDPTDHMNTTGWGTFSASCSVGFPEHPPGAVGKKGQR